MSLLSLLLLLLSLSHLSSSSSHAGVRERERGDMRSYCLKVSRGYTYRDGRERERERARDPRREKERERREKERSIWLSFNRGGSPREKYFSTELRNGGDVGRREREGNTLEIVSLEIKKRREEDRGMQRVPKREGGHF